MIITPGFEDHERTTIAAMYWVAFGPKLNTVMGPKGRAQAFITTVLDPTHALCARDSDGTLLGVVGFKTYDSALVGGTWRDLARHYGWLSSVWRIALIALLERSTDNDRFLMDGIFVRDEARGRGVGTALLNAICDEARTRGYRQIRLDVIDTNPRAKALYQRTGFVVTDTQTLGPLRHIFGFKSADTMVKSL